MSYHTLRGNFIVTKRSSARLPSYPSPSCARLVVRLSSYIISFLCIFPVQLWETRPLRREHLILEAGSDLILGRILPTQTYHIGKSFEGNLTLHGGFGLCVY